MERVGQEKNVKEPEAREEKKEVFIVYRVLSVLLA